MVELYKPAPGEKHSHISIETQFNQPRMVTTSQTFFLPKYQIIYIHYLIISPNAIYQPLFFSARHLSTTCKLEASRQDAIAQYPVLEHGVEGLVSVLGNYASLALRLAALDAPSGRTIDVVFGDPALIVSLLS